MRAIVRTRPQFSSRETIKALNTLLKSGNQRPKLWLVPPDERRHVGVWLDIQLRFDHTAGLDPIFCTVDGSNCNHNIDVSMLAGRTRPTVCSARGA
jgi:hypothetical protein